MEARRWRANTFLVPRFFRRFVRPLPNGDEVFPASACSIAVVKGRKLRISRLRRAWIRPDADAARVRPVRAIRAQATVGR